ncbi:ParB/RepB/Spo0J family partition protein [Hoyosella subflava]|uniref:ParB-like N-terminal domain-containing protein n=1 Tax=Hoyosella subflava (strain DSM 45089 / JCM 17490 / NBRC 109087 / DQS3-9A1) TaxID=443218 RepID=F6EFL6_HOYSD|nr:ParB/RepB/Spo0J family partition protein [Hoyosella subflava]AEF40945.1 hypothetical protein AS9A_2498 [Hoyosella subflava DQS3-9A1]
MARDTGFPATDAEFDFARQRRRASLSKLSKWMLGQSADVNSILPFDEVVSALGRREERQVGLRVIDVDDIVGSVDRTRDFDHRFRPTTSRTRERWERLAVAQRRGEAIPPIDVYQVGNMYFVVDGHHRVSIARAVGMKNIEAYVTEIRTKLSPEGVHRRGDIVKKDLRRLFVERVPLAQPDRGKVKVTDPWDYPKLAEAVEAWGFRYMQQQHAFFDRQTIAKRWFDEEYTQIVEMGRDCGVHMDKTDAELYMWLTNERYRMIRSHRWDENVARELVAKSMGRKTKVAPGAQRRRRS